MSWLSELLEDLESAKAENTADLLHDRLADERRDQVGLLLYDGDEVCGVVSAPLVSLQAEEASPGALLVWAVSLGATSTVGFHSRVGSASLRIKRSDRDYLQRLVTLSELVDAPLTDYWLFGKRPERLSLRSSLGNDWPTVSQPAEMARWNLFTRTAPPRYRDPLSGETWNGRGERAIWIREALDMGLTLEELRLGEIAPSSPGLPAGAHLFSVAHRRTPRELSALPAGGQGIDAGYDLHRSNRTRATVAVVRAHLGDQVSRLPFAGALFWDLGGLPVGPEPGHCAALGTWGRKPSRLFSRTSAQGATAAMTFSVGKDDEPALDKDADRLLLRWILAGSLLGCPVEDHLIFGRSGEYRALRRSSLRGWPRLEPVSEPIWPAASPGRGIVWHPDGERSWSGRGQKPGWLLELQNGGVRIENLRAAP